MFLASHSDTIATDKEKNINKNLLRKIWSLFGKKILKNF